MTNASVVIPQLLSTQFLVAPVATYTISAIPAFNNYLLYWNVETTTASVNYTRLNVNINGLSAAHYQLAQILQTNTTSAASTQFNATLWSPAEVPTTLNNFSFGSGMAELNVPSNGTGYVSFSGFGSLAFSITSGNFLAGSYFALYGMS